MIPLYAKPKQNFKTFFGSQKLLWAIDALDIRIFFYMPYAPLKLFVLKMLFHLEETWNRRRIATSWNSIMSVRETTNYYFTLSELTADEFDQVV